MLRGFLDGLLPADGLPFARATLATRHATHGLLDARRTIDALHVGRALKATAAVAVVRVIAWLKLHHFAVTHVGEPAARTHAVRAAHDLMDFFAITSSLVIVEFFGNGQVGTRSAQACSCAYRTGGFEKTAAREPLRAVCS